MWRITLRATRRVAAPSSSAAWPLPARALCGVELTSHDRHAVADALLRGGHPPCQIPHHGLWTHAHAWVAHAPLLPPTRPVRNLSTSPPEPPQKESQQQQQLQRLRALPRGTPDGVNAGWTYDEVINAPNALSLGRALSGPVLAVFILQVCPGTCLCLISAG